MPPTPTPQPRPYGAAPASPTLVGTVTHWYPHVDAAIVRIDAGELRIGDLIRFEGHTTDFEHRVTQMEIDHRSVQTASAGQVVGIQVRERVREHDRVLKVQRS